MRKPSGLRSRSDASCGSVKSGPNLLSRISSVVIRSLRCGEQSIPNFPLTVATIGEENMKMSLTSIEPQESLRRWSLFENTDPSVATALTSFTSVLTEQHSITSRRHSIRRLLADHVDEPVAELVSIYSGHWNKLLLVGYRPSITWHQPPPGGRFVDLLEESL